jgi:hypothetical protein
VTTTFEDELRYRQPGTVMIGIGPDGARIVRLADNIVAVDIDAANRLLREENERLRAKGLVTGHTEPLVETADGELVLDADHTYHRVRSDRLQPTSAIYERVR